MEASENKVPKHVGIIVDGNRRFAKRLMLKPWKGHEWGTQKIEKLFDWCKEYNVKELTLYTLSIDNFNRPKEEFNYLMKLFKETFYKWKDNKAIHENKIKVRFIGRTWMFADDIQKLMKEFEDMTKDYNNYIVNFAMAYGGRAEIIDAVKKLGQDVKDGKLKVEDIDENTLSSGLYLNSEPDLIIRTGGEKRLSSFLLWQGHYAELVFLDKFWPEFEKEDFVGCLEEYSNRQRRFGK